MQRQRVLVFCSALWLCSQTLAAPVPDSGNPPISPSYRSSIDVLTTTSTKSASIFTSPDAAPSIDHSTQTDTPFTGIVEKSITPPADSSPSPIPSEFNGPSAGLDSSAITVRPESAQPPSVADSASTNASHAVTRDFAIGIESTPEPGSLGLLACATLLLLRRRRNPRGRG